MGRSDVLPRATRRFRAGTGNFKLDSTITNASGATPQADGGDSVDIRPVLLVRTVAPANDDRHGGCARELVDSKLRGTCR